MNEWLLLDANYLCHRAWHVFGESLDNGVLFGFFRDIAHLTNKFQTDRLVFCFDTKNNLRKGVYEKYKYRKKSNEQERQQTRLFLQQLKELRETWLYRIGYRNIFAVDGYEADDILAVLTEQLDGMKTIISADQDLYQLLAEQVRIWHPQTKKMMTQKTFVEKYEIKPVQWIQVKAIVGCSSDNIAGVKGVGEKTAIDWLKGRLKPSSVKCRAILDSMPTVTRNLSLVTLPFDGNLGEMEITEDEVTKNKWNRVVGRFQMETLIDAIPHRRGAKPRNPKGA